MAEIPQAALDAGVAALAEDGCRTGATHGIDARTVLEAAAPHIRADERRRVAEEIRARIDSAEDEHPFVEGMNAGFEYAARIAEGDNR